MELRIKPEFDGLTIVRNTLKIGKVIFNTTKVSKSQYINFFKCGFEDVFDIVDEYLEQLEREIKEEPEEIEKQLNNNKSKYQDKLKQIKKTK